MLVAILKQGVLPPFLPNKVYHIAIFDKILGYGVVTVHDMERCLVEYYVENCSIGGTL